MIRLTSDRDHPGRAAAIWRRIRLRHRAGATSLPAPHATIHAGHAQTATIRDERADHNARSGTTATTHVEAGAARVTRAMTGTTTANPTPASDADGDRPREERARMANQTRVNGAAEGHHADARPKVCAAE